MQYARKKIIGSCVIISSLLFIIGDTDPARGQKPSLGFNPPLQLIYDITYAGGRIAEVEFTESDPYFYKNQRVRELECRVESSGLLNLNGLYRSIVSDDYALVYFRSDEGQQGNKRVIEYHFDYQIRNATIIDNRIKGTDTVTTNSIINNIDKKYFDTVSMIFRIREGVDTMKTPSFIPIFIEGKQDSVLVESIQNVQSAGQNGDLVDAFLIKARLPYPPYPGFGDRVEIYISADDDRVPLRGRIQMALGYLEIKLRSE
jgi:hypothetical protein